jgi:transketolase
MEIGKSSKKIDALAIGAIRSLAIDMTNKAKSGHPGMALDAAPILYTLFKDHLVSDPNNPDWINRDRFVLSAGHASSLLYAMLHLCGYGLTMDDLKSFRQLGSLTPGHPEYGHTIGVDATAGPLGQGISQAVGMAIAEMAMAAEYPEGNQLINHYTYCLCGDGCLEEGLRPRSDFVSGPSAAQ